jgi:hypothetical protein
MLNSRTETIRFAKTTAIIVLILFVVTFVVYRSLNYIKGPSITIDFPQNGSIVKTKNIVISGNAQRINKITLNGYPIFIDEQGNWKENLIIFDGLNKITIYAEDQFGRTTSKQLDIIGQTNQ